MGGEKHCERTSTPLLDSNLKIKIENADPSEIDSFVYLQRFQGNNQPNSLVLLAPWATKRDIQRSPPFRFLAKFRHLTLSKMSTISIFLYFILPSHSHFFPRPFFVGCRVPPHKKNNKTLLLLMIAIFSSFPILALLSRIPF